MTRKQVFERIETWLVMLALENFPAEQVWSWDMSQWRDFYNRINKGKKT